MRNGFAKIRGGLEEHFINGNIGFTEGGIYLTIHLQSDFRTGIWTGSAKRLVATAPRGAKLRDIQRALQRLENIGFIRSFHNQGARGNYRVLIDKFEPTSGALRGKRLIASKSETWRNPHYEVCADADTETDTDNDADDVAEAAPYQDVDLRNRGKSRIIDSATEEVSTPKRSGQSSDDLFITLFQRLKKELPALTQKRFDFAIGQIRERATTPPSSRAYWIKSLRQFFSPENYGGEIDSFLVTTYEGLIHTGVPTVDAKEELKCVAAEHDLEYSAAVICRVIETAENNIEKSKSLRNELALGAGPTVQFASRRNSPAVGGFSS